MEVARRVQSIASKTLSKDTIPSEFIWSRDNEQVTSTLIRDSNDLQVPVIALDDSDEERLVTLIAKASSETGIFQVTNHGIPNDVIMKLQKVGKEFFELPQVEKEKYAKLPGSVEGYGSSLQKEDESKNGVKKGWVDHIFNKIWPASAIDLRFWPNNVDSYQEVTEEYAKHIKEVADKLFKCLSLGLGLEGHELKEAAGGDAIEYLLKINYYPVCPRPELALGVPPHTDMSAITLLIPNDVAGLQIHKDNRWYNVNYVPNAIIIHIGDQIEIMSNGKYKSVMHRSTVNNDRARYSWPVFLEPPSDHTIGPIPKLITKENPAKYKIKTYGDYAYCKFNKLPQ